MSETVIKQRPVDYDRAVKLGGAISRFKSMARTEKQRADDLEKQVQALTAENGTLKVKADTSLSSKRVEELTAENRGLKHRQAFDKLAASKGARADGLSDLWELSKYKPEGDEIDEASLGLLIDDQKAKRGYLFGESKPGETPAEEPAPKVPGPGSGQGAPIRTGQKFSDEQMNDPVFVMKNYDAITAASAERIASGQV